MSKNFATIFRILFLALLIGMMAVVAAPNPLSAQPQTGNGTALSVSLALSPEISLPGETVELTIEATNEGDVPVEGYTVQLYLTEGVTLAETELPHDLYEPVWSDTFTLSPGVSEILIVPLSIFEETDSLQGAAITYGDVIVARQEIGIASTEGNTPQTALTPEDDYDMPIPPEITCPSPPPISNLGSVALDALNDYYYGGGYTAGAYFSRLTWCNQFEGDWILDVADVTRTTPPVDPTADAVAFYEMTGDLLRDTQYAFSMSTLNFATHDETGDRNLVKTYLSPAILDLHNSIPANGTYPLLRFAFASRPPGGDSPAEVLEDLTFDLRTYVSEDPTDWHVSIATAYIGSVPNAPWNHSKIAVRDYQQAIVGGMNWYVNYLDPMENPVIDDERTTHPLYDLSMNVEGDSANNAGVYFDKIWKRVIDPLFPHLGNDCETTWAIPIIWLHDCPLSNVPDYAPGGNQIPDYSINDSLHIFGLGRGPVEWGPLSDEDYSADRAVLATLNAATESIFLSQHRLTLLKHQGSLYFFTPEIKEALINAVLRGVRVKISVSEPWPDDSDTPWDVFYGLQRALYEEAVPYYYSGGWGDPELEIRNSLCRLEVRPFHVPLYPLPETVQHVFHTHSKFFMADEQLFYVGSQNLYPGGIGEDNVYDVMQLNEYGFMVDDATLSDQIKEEYWDPIWNTHHTYYHPPNLHPLYRCLDGTAQYGLAVELTGWDAIGEGSGRVKVTWDTATEQSIDMFHVYRNTTPDETNWELVHTQEPEGNPTIGASYEWVDTSVTDGVLYYYWLADVESDGDIYELWGPKATTTAPPFFLDFSLESVAIQTIGTNHQQVYATVKNVGNVVGEDIPVNLSKVNGSQSLCIDRLEPFESVTIMFDVAQPLNDLALVLVNSFGNPCPHIPEEDNIENNRIGVEEALVCPPSQAFPADRTVVENETTYLGWGQCTDTITDGKFYQVRLRDVTPGETPQLLEIRDTAEPDLALSAFTFGDFQSRRLYGWSIRACSGSSCSEFSEERTFWWEASRPEIQAVYPTFLTREEEGELPFVITIWAQDSDTPQLAWSLENIGDTDIGGMVLNGHGHYATIEWIPTEAQGPSTNIIKLTASDGVSVDEKVLTIYVYELNRAPVISYLPDREVVIGDELSLPIPGYDQDIPVNTLVYSLVDNIPPGMTLDMVTGILDWEPEPFQTGVYQLGVQVSDGLLIDTATFQLDVVNTPSPPTDLNARYYPDACDKSCPDDGEELIGGYVELNWKYPQNDSARFNVYRSNTLPVLLNEENRIANDIPSAYFSDFSGSESYYYVVTAVVANKQSEPSNTVGPICTGFKCESN